MRGVTSAALYLPAWTRGARRVRGPDEDRFTMVATALERAVGEAPAGPGTLVVREVGGSTAGAEWAFPTLLGRSVTIAPAPRGRTGLDRSLTQARRGRGRQLVVAAEAADPPSAGLRKRAHPPTEGAVAFVVDEVRDAASILPTFGSSRETSGGTIDAVLRWFRERGAARDPRWRGDWTVTDRRPLRRAVPTPAEPTALGGRSEGAYLPRARYLEGLASRWRFVSEHCGRCDALTFPARGRCRTCGRSDALETRRLPLHGGTVFATTWIGRGGQPTEFDAQVESSGPYGVALVEIAEGVRVTLPTADAHEGDLAIGARVGTRIRRLYPMEGEWRYGRKAVPWSRVDGPVPEAR